MWSILEALLSTVSVTTHWVTQFDGSPELEHCVPTLSNSSSQITNPSYLLPLTSDVSQLISKQTLTRHTLSLLCSSSAASLSRWTPVWSWRLPLSDRLVIWKTNGYTHVTLAVDGLQNPVSYNPRGGWSRCHRLAVPRVGTDSDTGEAVVGNLSTLTKRTKEPPWEWEPCFPLLWIRFSDKSITIRSVTGRNEKTPLRNVRTSSAGTLLSDLPISHLRYLWTRRSYVTSGLKLSYCCR